MKDVLKFLVIILVLNCAFNSVGVWMGILPNLPPYRIPTQYGNVKGAEFGVRRMESVIPELNFSQGTRPCMYIDKVSDSEERPYVEFPLAGVN